MSSESLVKSVTVAFGTATSLAIPTTNTSGAFPLPRQDFTAAISVFGSLVTTTASTTASSTAAATVVVQASNDAQAWFGISSASATATIMTTCTGTAQTVSGTAVVGLNITGQRFGFARVVVTLNGTGSGTPMVAF